MISELALGSRWKGEQTGPHLVSIPDSAARAHGEVCAGAIDWKFQTQILPEAQLLVETLQPSAPLVLDLAGARLLPSL